jgi:hypothetical protein
MLKKEKLLLAKKFNQGKYRTKYHRFILEEKDDILELRFAVEEYKTRFNCPYDEMDKITMPMTLVPEYQAMILKGFYDPDGAAYETIETEKYLYKYSSLYDERADAIKKINLVQRLIDTHDVVIIELEWNIIDIPRAPLSARVMPESLAWLVKNLKSIYNEWQKDHPECEKIR